MRPTQTIIALITLFCCLPGAVLAQGTSPAWLEESLHGNGKINTVIAVVAIILLGIGIWLFVQDRKLTRLEDAIRSGDRRK
jgi:uncharacterized protein HemX